MINSLRLSATKRRYFTIAGVRYRILGLREDGIYALQIRPGFVASEVFIAY